MSNYDKDANEYLIPFYNRYPITIVKGHKHWVWDSSNKKYLDLTSGIGVVDFGHANPVINRAVKKQLNKISHISNLFIIPIQIELAKKISEKSFSGKAFFCNSGAEANETALKIARIIGNLKNKTKNKVLSLKESFHGRTIATISMTGQDKYKKGFEPLLQNIEFVDPDNINDLRQKFTEDTCAIFLEAIQGEGGIKRLSKEFLSEAGFLAQKYSALIVFDEVQAGMGRTGKYFAYQNFSVEPDMITLAKGLGNGFPIGAILVKKEIADLMPSGIHASTFGGNYAACAAGIQALKLLNEKKLNYIQNVSLLFEQKLDDLKTIFPDIIKENRVFGLMIGIDINDKYPVKDIINSLIEKGILTLRAGSNVLRLLPPYTVGEKEIDLFGRKLYEVLSRL